MMKHIKSINELFGFLKKKFTQDEIESIKSLFADTIDELDISNKDISLKIVFDDYKSQLLCTIKVEKPLFDKTINSDEINLFLKTLEANFKVIRGYDTYNNYEMMRRALEITKDRMGGLFKFKLMKK